jgi:hypothetical protein
MSVAHLFCIIERYAPCVILVLTFSSSLPFFELMSAPKSPQGYFSASFLVVRGHFAKGTVRCRKKCMKSSDKDAGWYRTEMGENVMLVVHFIPETISMNYEF